MGNAAKVYEEKVLKIQKPELLSEWKNLPYADEDLFFKKVVDWDYASELGYSGEHKEFFYKWRFKLNWTKLIEGTKEEEVEDLLRECEDFYTDDQVVQA